MITVGAREILPAAHKKHGCFLKLPKSYETVLCENAGTLSRNAQRLSIARAMRKDALFVIGDEVMANVNPENERELAEAIFDLTCEKPVVQIIHRFKSTRRFVRRREQAVD